MDVLSQAESPDNTESGGITIYNSAIAQAINETGPGGVSAGPITGVGGKPKPKPKPHGGGGGGHGGGGGGHGGGGGGGGKRNKRR
jgi:hypothetical protein